MEETLATAGDVTQILLNTINSIFSRLFSSIDNSIYSTLDDLVFINVDIFNDSFFQRIFGTSSTNGILIIANSLLIAFALYYCFKLIYSNFVSIQIESPYQFLFKLLIFGIIMNSSYFISQQFVSINSLISSSIREIGENIFQKNISFSSLIQKLNSIISVDTNTFDLFSFNRINQKFYFFLFY